MSELFLLNSQQQLIIGTFNATAVTQAQFRQWLNSVDVLPKGQRFCDTQILADPYAISNIAWNAPFVQLGGTLSNLAKTFFGYTVTQMRGQFALMANFPPFP